MSSAPVVAAVDGSDDSLRALDWAVGTARARHAPLRVVHVRQYATWAQVDTLRTPPPDAVADPVLDRARARLAHHPDPPATEYALLEGAPSAVLPELGAEAQLLVLGSRGRGGFAALLLGSNGMAVARDAACPVVVVPRPGRGDDGSAAHGGRQGHDGATAAGHGPEDTGGATADRGREGEVPAPSADGSQAPGRGPEGPGAGPGESGRPYVVVGLNVDSPDDAALAFAFAEAARRGARLRVTVAYPWPPPAWLVPGELAPLMIDRTAVESETRALAEGFLGPHRARSPEVRADAYVVPGDAAGALVAAARGADLLVVGRHRRRLLAPARLMGSVTHAVLLHAPAPVAVVPPAPPQE